MTARRVVAVFLALIMMSGPGVARAVDPPPAPTAPPAPAAPSAPPGVPVPAPASDVTPARLSYLNGEVSFWRPGAQEWTPSKVNMPLAPGDLLYTGQGGNIEIQVGPRAFVRASEGTHIGLDNQEPDFVQFRLTAGHAAVAGAQRVGSLELPAYGLPPPAREHTVRLTGGVWRRGAQSVRWLAHRRDVRVGVGSRHGARGLGAVQHGPLDLGPTLRMDLAR